MFLANNMESYIFLLRFFKDIFQNLLERIYNLVFYHIFYNEFFFTEEEKECPHLSKSIAFGKFKKALQKAGIKSQCTACERAEAKSPQKKSPLEEEVNFTLIICLFYYKNHKRSIFYFWFFIYQ